MIRFKCERCGATIRCADTEAGGRTVCPTCQHRAAVPERPAPARRRLLLYGGLAAGGVLLAWVLWSAGGADQESDARKTRVSREKGLLQERETEFRQRMEEERKFREAWDAEGIARRLQEERDRAQRAADLKARQLREEADRKSQEEERKKRDQLEGRTTTP